MVDHDEALRMCDKVLGMPSGLTQSGAAELARAYLDLHARTHGIGKQFLDEMRQTSTDLKTAVGNLSEAQHAELTLTALRRVKEAAERHATAVKARCSSCVHGSDDECTCAKNMLDRQLSLDALDEALLKAATRGSGDV